MEKRSRNRLIFYILLLLFFFIYLSFMTLSLKKLDILIQFGFWIILMFVGLFLFPETKERKKYLIDVYQIIIIYLFIYYILYFLSGILVGYTESPFVHDFIMILKNILPVFLIIIFQEFIRGKLLVSTIRKDRIIITMIFTFLTSITLLKQYNINDGKEILLLFGLVLLPSITKNILCTYLTYEFSYKVSICYRSITELIIYIIPIFPLVSTYIESILLFLLPMIILDKVYNLGIRKEKEIVRKKGITTIPLIIFVVCVLCLISGIFRYQMISIGSNSMNPVIQRGDTIIFDKEYKKVKKGDILVFSNDGVIVVHRVIEIKNNGGKIYYRTKGDNNRVADQDLISHDQIIGIMKWRIPYIGYPSVWIKELG